MQNTTYTKVTDYIDSTIEKGIIPEDKGAKLRKEITLIEGYLNSIHMLSHLQTDDNDLRDHCLSQILECFTYLIKEHTNEIERQKNETNSL